MPDIFSYIYPYTEGYTLNQFFGLRKVASNICGCKSTDEYTKEMFLADFPQFSKLITTLKSSTFTRDPSDVGGPNVAVEFDGFTAYVSGEIEWYPADDALDRPAGNRVGFEITAPTDLEDVSNAQYSIDGGPPRLLSDDPNVSGNPRLFWWYPLVLEDTTEHVLQLDWDGFGARGVETFTIKYSDFILESPTESARALPTRLMLRDLRVTDSDETVISLIPDEILDMFIALANEAIQKCRWFGKWRWATGLYIAHYATLYLRLYQEPSPNNTASSAASSGSVLGIVKSAQLGDASIGYDVSAVVSATEDWGAWNSTVYGQLLVTEARWAGLGGTYAI